MLGQNTSLCCAEVFCFTEEHREARPYGFLVVVLRAGDDVGFFVVDTSVAPELEPAAVVVGS